MSIDWQGRAPRAAAWLLGLASLLAVSAAVRAAAAAQVGEVSFLQGDAERQPQGSDKWVALKQGGGLHQGDRLRTKAASRLEAKLKDGSLLRLGEKSELKLELASFKDGNSGPKKVKVRLAVGKVWAAVTKLFGGDSEFEVTTTNAVAGVRGTRFEASQDTAGSTTVKVYGGKVLVSNKPIYQVAGATKAKRVQVAGPQEISKQQWNEMVAGAMQLVRVSAAGDMSEVQPFAMNDGGAAAGDDWEAWNSERDRVAGISE